MLPRFTSLYLSSQATESFLEVMGIFVATLLFTGVACIWCMGMYQATFPRGVVVGFRSYDTIMLTPASILLVFVGLCVVMIAVEGVSGPAIFITSIWSFLLLVVLWAGFPDD